MNGSTSQLSRLHFKKKCNFTIKQIYDKIHEIKLPIRIIMGKQFFFHPKNTMIVSRSTLTCMSVRHVTCINLKLQGVERLKI